MEREQSEATANFRDSSANHGSARSRNPRKTAVWPDGGVVTQRTANPLKRPGNPQKFAMLPVRSGRVSPCSLDADCELFALVPIAQAAGVEG